METRYSVCPHDCPDTCGWRVTMDKGQILRIEGDAAHPVTQGVICEKVRYYTERVDHPDRILYPMRRRGPKGSGQFERISWEAAFEEITDRWTSIIHKYGAEAILPYSYAGTEGVINKASMDRRFFNRLGATRLERTICSAAGSQGYNVVYGDSRGINPLESVKAKLIIFWGINALETNLHQAMLAEKARKNGAKLIVIDVHRNKTARWADTFYQILPGSDGALALGMAHVILKEQLTDFTWAKAHLLGLDSFVENVKAYEPERVAQLTGLPAKQIEALARAYATQGPSLIRIGNGLQHHDNGGMSTRAIASLPALIGAWNEPGGGAIKFNSGYFPLNRDALERPDLAIPARSVNMNQLGRVLTELEPPIYSMYVYNSNPAVVAPEQALVLRGLAREDLFTVVHEQMWTDTARWADLVLPATTHLEHSDLYISYWHCVLQWADAVIPRRGESLPNIEVFQRLAQKMGFSEPCFSDTTEEIARQALDTPYWQKQGITLERLQTERFIALTTVPSLPFAQGGFSTPSGHAEVRSERAREQGWPLLPEHAPLIEGPETATTDLPLTLISPPNHAFLNSTFANLSLKADGVPQLEIHPHDALSRNIGDGDWVNVFNERGRVTLQARVDDAVLPGVVVATGVWWLNDYPGGQGINVLTPSRLADMGKGATFFSNLVNVEKTPQPADVEI